MTTDVSNTQLNLDAPLPPYVGLSQVNAHAGEGLVMLLGLKKHAALTTRIKVKVTNQNAITLFHDSVTFVNYNQSDCETAVVL